MHIYHLFHHTAKSVHSAGQVSARSFKSLLRAPQIAIYPILAAGFVLVTSPIISAFVVSMWHKVEQPALISGISNQTPHVLLQHLGLIAFSVYYANFVADYFVCSVAAATLAKLENRKVSVFYGLRILKQRFLRITKFCLVSIFFMPLGIIAQRKKMKTVRGAFEVVISSFSMSMPQLAAEVITSNDGIMRTIRKSSDTLGKLWKENLVIRAGMIGSVLLLGSISFLPKLVQELFFNSPTAQVIGWVLTAILGASSYVLLHVMSTVITTTLYFEAKNPHTKT
jgi:hypothetical protein